MTPKKAKTAAKSAPKAKLPGAPLGKPPRLSAPARTVDDLGKRVAKLDDASPVVLLPLRVEVQLSRPAIHEHGPARLRAPLELWVRVWPDACSIATRPRAPSASELEQIVRFHAERAAGRTAQTCFAELCARLGVQRAQHLLGVVTLDAQGHATVVDDDSGVRERAVSFVLPEQLLFATFRRDGARGPAIVGHTIPDELWCGPAPDAQIGHASDGSLRLDPGLAWHRSFEKAVELGMGAKIPIQPAELASLDRLVVAGVRTSDRGADGSKRLARLLAAQRATRGLSFVPYGTATNATRDSEAGDPSADEASALAAVSAATLDRESDGGRLARALRLPIAQVAQVVGATRRDVTGALAAGRALFPATWGHALTQLLGVSRATAADARRFAGHYVSGAGALPSLRFGDLPYGVLVTSCFSRWKADPKAPAALTARTELLLSRVWPKFSELADRWVTEVGRGLGDGPVDPVLSLTQALALQPSSTFVEGRNARGPTAMASWYESGTDGAKWRAAAAALAREVGLVEDEEPLPKLLELFFEERSRALSGAFVDEDGPSEHERATPSASGVRVLAWLAEASVEQVRAALLGEGEVELTTLLERLAARALRFELDRVAREATGKKPFVSDLFDAAALTDSDLLAQPGALRPARRAVGLSDDVAELRAALRELDGAPSAQLERWLGEHLDLASHRADAWLLGLAHERLDLQTRAAAGHGSIHLGAWGALHGLSELRAAEAPPAMFVHAPSLPHALAGAIVASADEHRASQLSPEEDPGLAGTDLSSARIRRAFDLLSAIREGTTIERLLGYRIERHLHDAGASDRIAPLRAAVGVASSTAESGTSEVVDGRAALAKASGSDPMVLAALSAARDDLDAAGDLLQSEGVLQWVRGDAARAGAALDGLTEGAIPAELDFTRTPRAGASVRVEVRQVLPAPPAGAPRSLRASVEPRVEAWLSEQLGGLETLHVAARSARHDAAATELSLAELPLAALDLATSEEPVALIERAVRIVWRRRGESVPPAEILTRGATRANGRWLADVLPVLGALREVLSVARCPASALATARGEAKTRLGAITLQVEAGAQTGGEEAVRDLALSLGLAGADSATASELKAALAARATAARGRDEVEDQVLALFGARIPLTALEELVPQIAPGTPSALELERWLEDAARVRPAVDAWGRARVLGRLARGRVRPLAGRQRGPSQLPWAAGKVDPQRLPGGVECLVAAGAPPSGPVASLLVDQWFETIPSPHVTTAIAARVPRPRSEPAHTWLCVVTPAETGSWRLGDIVGAIHDTLDLAKLRLLEPHHVAADPELAQLLPVTLVPYGSPGSLGIDLIARRAEERRLTEPVVLRK